MGLEITKEDKCRPTIVSDVIQCPSDLDESTGEHTRSFQLVVLDDRGQKTRYPAPCSRCQFAIQTNDHPHIMCRAGITRCMEINIMDDTDPDVRGWADNSSSRPINHKDVMYGHNGRFMSRLEWWISSGASSVTSWKRVIMKHIRAVGEPDGEDGAYSSQTMDLVCARVLKEIIDTSDIAPSSTLQDNCLEDDIVATVRRMMGSEDIMNIIEGRVETAFSSLDHIHLFQSDPSYTTDLLDTQIWKHRNIEMEREHFSPPHKHYLITQRYNYMEEMVGSIVRGRRCNGWLESRSVVRHLPVNETIFRPHEDVGSVRITTKCFALQNYIQCPIASRAPSAMRNKYTLSKVFQLKGIDRELAEALARGVTESMRRNAMISSRIKAPELLRALLRITTAPDNHPAVRMARKQLKEQGDK